MGNTLCVCLGIKCPHAGHTFTHRLMAAIHSGDRYPYSCVAWEWLLSRRIITSCRGLLPLSAANSPGPCVRKIFLVGILWTFKFLCRNLQFKWYWIEKKLSPIFSQPFGPVLCKLDMTSLYSYWITTKCLQFDSRLFESNIMYLKLQFTLHFDCFKEWTNGPNV